MSTQICGVVLPKQVAHQARVVAAQEGKSRSALMRDLLLAYLRGDIRLDVHADQQAQEVHRDD